MSFRVPGAPDDGATDPKQAEQANDAGAQLPETDLPETDLPELDAEPEPEPEPELEPEPALPEPELPELPEQEPEPTLEPEPDLPEPEPDLPEPEPTLEPEPEPEFPEPVPEPEPAPAEVTDVSVEVETDDLEAILGDAIDAAAHRALESRQARDDVEESGGHLPERTCPAGHLLVGAHVRPGFTCDVCGIWVQRDTLLYGCRPCNYDECQHCYDGHQPQQHGGGAQLHEGEPPLRRVARTARDREDMTAQELESEMEPYTMTYTDAELAQMSEQEQLAAVIAMSMQQMTADAVRMTLEVGRQTSVPEFLCKICYMNDAEEDAIRLRCGHRWHKDCLLQLLRSKVSDAELQILCPDIADDVDERELLGNAREVGCTHVIARPIIFALAQEMGDTALQEQYARFEELESNPSVRECPVDGCGHRQEGSPRSPNMGCEKCGLEYCFVHSAAHPGETCRVYERKQRVVNVEHAKFIVGHTLPCPWCKKPTTKQGGCNHMTCSTCGKDWCWVCGCKASSHSWHYDDANVWGCPGMQFASHFSLLHRYALYTLRIYSLILVVPMLLAGVVTALGSVVLCSPCLCIVFRQGWPRGGELPRLIFMLAAWPFGLAIALQILATACVTVIVVLPVACAIRPCRRSMRERENFDTAMMLGCWPLLFLALALALFGLVITLPFFPLAVYFHSQTRPPLDQDDRSIAVAHTAQMARP